MGLKFILAQNSINIINFLEHNTFFNFIDCIGLFLPLIVFLFLGKRVAFLQKSMVILFYFLFFILSIIATYSRKFGVSNLVIYNIIPILLIIPLHLFFRSHLISILWKRLLLTIGLLLFIYYLITLVQLSSSLNLLYYLFFALYIMLGSFAYLIGELNFISTRSSRLRVEFWFIVCLFFYASICLLVWSLYDWLIFTLHDPRNASLVWSTLHNGTLFIHCFIFSIALIWTRHRI